MSNGSRRHSPESTDSSHRPTFEHGAGFLLARLGAMAEQDWGGAVREAGLRPADFAVLVVLLESERRDERPTQRQVAERVGVDPRNLVATVARLRKGGLVSIVQDTVDGRAHLLGLTKAGRVRIVGLQAALAIGRADFFEVLGDDEYATLCALLERVYAARVRAIG